MFCKNCGVPLKDGALFCTGCGASVTPPQAGAPAPGPAFAEQPTAVLPVTPPQAPPAGPGPYVAPVQPPLAPVAKGSRTGLTIALAVVGLLVVAGAVVFMAYSQGMFDKVEKSVATADGTAGTTTDTDHGIPPKIDTTGGTTTTVNQKPPTGTAAEITSLASVSASSRRKGYPAANLVDHKNNKVWSEGKTGEGDYGEGESVTFTFPNDVWVTQVSLVPGYVKYDSKNSVDRWYSNGRVRAAKLVFSDGTESQETQFDTDAMVFQNITLPSAKLTRSVKLVIVSTDPANTGTHHDASDTCIAEMRVTGFDQ
jgi:hypothetical protein